MGIEKAVCPTWEHVLSEQIREHSRLFFRLAFAVLREPEAAEDVCQQAFLKAWEHREHLRDARRLRAWLARVVVNESLQAVRRMATESRVLHQCAVQAPRMETDSGPTVDMREAILLALEELPESMRLIVILRVMQGLSGNEVKEMLGCSAGEVSRQLHQGMEQLRELLASWKDHVLRT